MNYRHAYHAGNFADCVKHALQHHILAALRRKPAPFRVLDTHAGIGAYDLREERAERTGEWRAGIGRLEGIAEGPLAPWLSAVREFGWPPLYPGSPALSRAMLREGDRLVLCELHPEDQEELRARIGRDRRVAVHARDGWEAATALTPFPEKRGLLLMDPPFEQEGEFDRLADTIIAVSGRFRGFPLAVYCGSRCSSAQSDAGRASAIALRLGMASMPKRKVTASASQASSCLVWVKSVSPRT